MKTEICLAAIDWQTLEAHAAESPKVAYLLEAYIMKLFYGVHNEGYMMEGRDHASRFKLCMRFEEAAASLKKLSDIGINKILTQSVGWNARGHDGMYPERFPVEPRVGGEAGFRRLIAQGQALGYHMQVHDNFMMNCIESPAYDPDVVVQDIYGDFTGDFNLVDKGPYLLDPGAHSFAHQATHCRLLRQGRRGRHPSQLAI